MYRQRRKKGLMIIIGIFLMVLVIGLLSGLLSSTEKEASDLVEEFYHYEQEGQFSESWELFHPQMKERFTKGHYIQDRAHVFMNHFGVETFRLQMGEAEEVKDWKMSKESKTFKKVYRVPITQTFKGKYGNFNINQEVYVIQEEDKWGIVWDYNK